MVATVTDRMSTASGGSKDRLRELLCGSLWMVGYVRDVDDTWFSRELPVLEAIVEIHDQTGRDMIRSAAVEEETGLDHDTVSRAVRALHSGNYLVGGKGSAQQAYMFVGSPTGEARRAVGAWPTAEKQLDRVIAALTTAAEDPARPEEERSKLRQLALGAGGAAYQIILSALGGAGGNIISG
jgi:hypothetical protein